MVTKNISVGSVPSLVLSTTPFSDCSVHGDLKPENLLLSSWDDEEADLKLVDFGCSVIVDRASADEAPPHSTICYDPPEKILGDLSPSYESDVWAAGCILYIVRYCICFTFILHLLHIYISQYLPTHFVPYYILADIDRFAPLRQIRRRHR